MSTSTPSGTPSSAARRGAGLCLAVLGLFAAACGDRGSTPAPPTAEEDASAHRQEIESWWAERDASLRDPEGYLSLVGLHWLDQGPNRLGSDPMSDLVLPAQAPARVGTLTLDDQGTVTLELAPGVEATIDGEPFRRAELVPDVEDGTTEVTLGSLQLHAIRRGDWTGLRVRDLESPALAAFEGVEHFPVDPDWRLEARFEPFDPPREMLIDDVTGNAQPTRAVGELVFRTPAPDADGSGEHHLVAFDGGPERLFLVFSDATSGKETYGAGRYLSAPRPDGEGRVTVDFNRAYNPPCAFTPYATCPLPPKENRLDVAVTAGEKVYRGEAVH